MISSLRFLAWRVVQHSRRVLLQHGIVNRQPSALQQQRSPLYHNWQHQQALKQSVSGIARPYGHGSGGSSSTITVGAAQPASSLVGLLGRLGPWLSGAVRRLSVHRCFTSHHLGYRDTAPLFALVGVSLVGIEDTENDKDGEEIGSGKKSRVKGFVTRQEELEAICCGIRSAVSQTDWLFDAHTWASSERVETQSSGGDVIDEAPIHNDSKTEENGSNNKTALSSHNNQDPCNNSPGVTDADGKFADSNHIYSLQDLDLAGVIDKGCNAVVYAARWKNSVPNEDSPTSTNSITTSVDVEHLRNSFSDEGGRKSSDDEGRQISEDGIQSSNRNLCNSGMCVTDAAKIYKPTLISGEVNANVNRECDVEHSLPVSSLSNMNIDSNLFQNLNLEDVFMQQQSGSSRLLNVKQDLPSILPFHGSTISLHHPPGLCSSNSSRILLDTIESNGDFSGLDRNPRHCSLAEDVSRLLSSGGFAPPITQRRRAGSRVNKSRKRVRFMSTTSVIAAEDSQSSAGRERMLHPLVHGRDHDGGTTDFHEESSSQASTCLTQYPLAVKLVFNYEAASNAPAILSALYRELLPARRVQLDERYAAWRIDFFGSASHRLLPSHPNIVSMPCAFVDRVPLLEGGLQHYPTALPARLHPYGLGRNMSLFCVMRRYDLTLSAYLQRLCQEQRQVSSRTALLLLTQLLEALEHLHRHHICHRDLKADNILLSLHDGAETPWLVLTDFGCCLAAGTQAGLAVPFVSREAEPRQGNVALMSPEVKTARPGLLQFIDFSCCDIWAAGALAYEIYGLRNPFLSGEPASHLDSATYREASLPGLPRTVAPAPVRRLVADMLRRRPNARPTPPVAATLCQLCLWAPSQWLNRHALTKPTHDQVMEWLLCLTTKILCERRGSNSVGSGETEYRLVSTFLARVRYSDVLQAISWNRAF